MRRAYRGGWRGFETVLESWSPSWRRCARPVAEPRSRRGPGRAPDGRGLLPLRERLHHADGGGGRRGRRRDPRRRWARPRLRQGLRQQRRRHRAASRAGRAPARSAWSPISDRRAASTRPLDAFASAAMPVRGVATSGWRGRAAPGHRRQRDRARGERRGGGCGGDDDRERGRRATSPAIERRPAVRRRRRHRSRRAAGDGRRRRAAGRSGRRRARERRGARRGDASEPG